MGHARLSASQTKRWFNCRGYPAVIERFLEQFDRASGQAALLGTASHVLVERCLKEGSEPEDYRDRLIQIVIDKDGNEEAKILGPKARMPANSELFFEVDGEMIDAVTCMTDYVRGRLADLFGGRYMDARNNPGASKRAVEDGVLRLEQRVNPLPGRDDTGGTGDVIIDAWPELKEIVDYKNGSGVFVPVEKNHQVRSYGLGSLMDDGVLDYDRIRYTICQPRHRSAPPDGIMYEECTVKELLDYQIDLGHAAHGVDRARDFVNKVMSDGLTELSDVVEAADKEGLFSVGEDGSHCSYCEIASGCGAAKRKVQEMACMDFDDEPDKVNAPTGDNHLAIVLPWIPFIETWCKQAFGNADRLLMSGSKVGEYKVVRRKSSGRKFKKALETKDEDGEVTSSEELTDDKIADIMKAEFDVDRKDLFTKPKLCTGPQIEKLIKGAKEKKRYSSLLLFSPPGGLTIAPGDDPRPAVDVSPADDFDDDVEVPDGH